MLWNNVFYIVGAMGAALAPNLTTLVGARFLSGIGAGVSTSLSTLYIAECVPSHRRGELTAWSPFVGTAGTLALHIIQ